MRVVSGEMGTIGKGEKGPDGGAAAVPRALCGGRVFDEQGGGAGVRVDGRGDGGVRDERGSVPVLQGEGPCDEEIDTRKSRIARTERIRWSVNAMSKVKVRPKATHGREGRDDRARADDGRAAVSIHAPVKGATPDRRRQAARHLVSIHAPVKGATRAQDARGRRGSVSIHAPVKGATRRP